MGDLVEEAAELAATGWAAVQIAEKLKVNVRTVYKWLARSKKASPPPTLDAAMSRSEAISRLIDNAVAATLADPSEVNTKALARIARSALALQKLPSKSESYKYSRAKLLAKLNQASAKRAAKVQAEAGQSAIATGQSAVNDGHSAVNDGQSAVNDGQSAVNDGQIAAPTPNPPARRNPWFPDSWINPRTGEFT